MTIIDMWTPTGVILGFQMTLFSWRLSEEAKVGDKNDIPWLTPSDYLNIFGMLILVIGVYLLPILELTSINSTKVFFGLGIFVFIGQAIGTAAHYQLFNKTKSRIFVWFPKQEKIILGIFCVLTIIYLLIAIFRFK